MRKLSLIFTCLFFIGTLSFAGPTNKGGSYMTITVIQGKGQTEILVHQGGKQLEDKVIKTAGDESKDIDPAREQEYNAAIDMLNKYSEEGYDVVNVSVAMAGSDQVHPYTVYLLRKKH